MRRLFDPLPFYAWRYMLAVAGAALVPSGVMAQWVEAVTTDYMTRQRVVTLTVDSADSLELQFPYAGRNHGRLMIRQEPRHGLDVAFMIEKGQLLCRLSGCRLLIRFDNDKPQMFEALRSNDMSSTVLFIKDSRRFVASAKKAQEILVEATYYEGGNQVLTFSTPKGLTWTNSLKLK